MSNRLIMLVQAVDVADDHRGSMLDWISAFAKHYTRVDVIAVTVGRFHLPANVFVHSLGKERGYPKIIQAMRFYWYLVQSAPRARGIFAYASPIFIIAAWPMALVCQCRMVLWYLHRANPLKLRVALRLVTHLVTADVASLTIQSQKIAAVGHGIAIERFTMHRDWSDITSRSLRLVSVGRIAPIKDYETIIHAVALLKERGRGVMLRLVGAATTDQHRHYEQQLRALVQRLGLGDVTVFVGPVQYPDMPGQYHWADMVIGATPHGGIDKTLLEAMAAGCIVLTSNDVMRRYLEPYADRLLFPHGDSQALADKVVGSLGECVQISSAMVTNVRRYHDVSATVERVSALL